MPGASPFAVACTHTGSGREINVGGPVNSPNQVTAITHVEWENLGAGDTVRIHWRAAPYAERIALFRSGTQAAPIRVCGVPGPSGERPFITGIGAATRAGSQPAPLQPYGVVTISGPGDSRVEHVILEGLRIGDTKNGPAPGDNAPFTDGNGAPRNYVSDAACIRIRQAANITIRNNEITNCADGIFAGSTQQSENHVTRNLVVEGNYLHGSGVVGVDQRHQAYLQGMDITVQGNYFGPTRSNSLGAAAGNQIKTRAAGLVVRYNYVRNGARTLDLVEPEEHIVWLAPWRYARHRVELGLTGPALQQHNLRQERDWNSYQNAHVYGNLLHVVGRGNAQLVLPSNLVHYGFDNSPHDRAPGTLWFFHNTVLWETDRNNLNPVRLFDYGSNSNGDHHYKYSPALLNVGNELHYLTSPTLVDPCQAMTGNCVDWGKMLQTSIADFGRMNAFHNALVRVPFTQGGTASDLELNRRRWDKLDITGPMWLGQGWNQGANGGFGAQTVDAAHAYPGGNAAHHVTGLPHILAPAGVPIERDTFAPVTGSTLHNAAAAWPGDLADSFKPAYSVTVDPAVPGRLVFVPRTQWRTIGAVE